MSICCETAFKSGMGPSLFPVGKIDVACIKPDKFEDELAEEKLCQAVVPMSTMVLLVATTKALFAAIKLSVSVNGERGSQNHYPVINS